MFYYIQYFRHHILKVFQSEKYFEHNLGYIGQCVFATRCKGFLDGDLGLSSPRNKIYYIYYTGCPIDMETRSDPILQFLNPHISKSKIIFEILE